MTFKTKKTNAVTDKSSSTKMFLLYKGPVQLTIVNGFTMYAAHGCRHSNYKNHRQRTRRTNDSNKSKYVFSIALHIEVKYSALQIT